MPLIRLSAHDSDAEGPNSKLSFNLKGGQQAQGGGGGTKYQLSPDQGILTAAAGATWRSGTVEYLEVSVSDAGRPQLTSAGLVEVTVDGGPAVSLRFERDLYTAELDENPESGRDVAQVGSLLNLARHMFLRQNLTSKSHDG